MQMCNCQLFTRRHSVIVILSRPELEMYKCIYATCITVTDNVRDMDEDLVGNLLHNWN